MLTIWGRKQAAYCDGIARRDFLRVGALGLGGLTLADLWRLQGATASSHKAVIMITMDGGPSQPDMYDMKPDAPVEIRGEFKPIQTNVPGLDVCELMPQQAKIADKLAIVRNWMSESIGHGDDFYLRGAHTPQRPALTSVVSKLRGRATSEPPCVHLNGMYGKAGFLGPAHLPFYPSGPAVKNMTLNVPPKRLAERRQLLQSFDTLQRTVVEANTDVQGTDLLAARAFDLLASCRVRDALDLNREPDRTRDKYGNMTSFLRARRLVEAGVSMVTVAGFEWDWHANSFATLRKNLPLWDHAISTLVADLCERGLDKDVCVIAWGEFGRTPRINNAAGRDHHPIGSVLLAGGGLKMGQVVGATDARGEQARGVPYSCENMLATLYAVLGIDLETTLTDHSGRPHYLLDDRRPIQELV